MEFEQPIGTPVHPEEGLSKVLEALAIRSGITPRSAEDRLLRFLIGAREIRESHYGWVGLSTLVCFSALKEACETTDGEFTALDLCSSLPVWAAHLRRVIPEAFGRDARVQSVDIEDPWVIRQKGNKSFTREFKRTPLFWEALVMRDHYQQDIFELNLPREKYDFITSIEGYPFYFDDGDMIDRETHMQFTLQIADALKPGGKAVFFPWYFQNDDRQKHRRLTFLENLWEQEGLRVEKVRHNWGHIMNNLTDDEDMLTFRSPLFQDYRRSFVSLELTKPMGSSQDLRML